jgi:ribosomal protein S18 acetylase RimI-like enzyme
VRFGQYAASAAGGGARQLCYDSAFAFQPIRMLHTSPITLRAMQPGDLDAILQVQAACYPVAMQEGADVVLARIRQAGDTSFVAARQDGAILAYVFAYRSVQGAVTPLDARFDVATAGDTLYLHDLAVAPQAAGQGLARRLAAHVDALARRQGNRWCALVSVQDSRRFWERLGYCATDCATQQARAALASYPPGALYMTLDLPRPIPAAHADASSLL